MDPEAIGSTGSPAGDDLEDCLHRIDDLEKENSTLRRQRDEYAKQLIVVQDRVASLARCGVCEEARRDAYIARLELARLQARTTSLPTNGDAEAASEEDSPRWLDPSSPSERAEEGALDAALADAMALQRRADQYHAAFLSVQADNKELRFKIDSFREDESRRLAEKERQLQQALDESNRALLTVKAERNNSRSRANSLSRELLQCEQANGKRMALISDLRLELAAQKGEIKSLSKKLDKANEERGGGGICSRGGSLFNKITRKVGRRGRSKIVPLGHVISGTPKRQEGDVSPTVAANTDRRMTTDSTDPPSPRGLRFFFCN